MGLRGPNGAGKTTLLRLVMGFAFPDAGRIDRGALTPAQIGYLPERAVYPAYPLLARLHRRAEWLAALLLSGLGITAMLALLTTVANLLSGRLSLDLPSALWIAPAWLALWLLTAALVLPLPPSFGPSARCWPRPPPAAMTAPT